MTHCYYADRRRIVTLRNGAPEWYNLDCPSTYRIDEDGETKVYHGYSLHAQPVTYDRDECAALDRFIAKSRAAFLRKYPSCA